MLETQAPNRFSIFHRGPSKGPDFEAWREGICRGFCRLDVGPADQDYIDCHNEFAQVNSIAVATPKGGSARFARTRDLLTDGCDDLVLISATRGTVRVTQRNKAIGLTVGQMCLTEMNVVGAADLTRSGGFTTARFPRRLLLQVAPMAETQLARPLGHDHTAGDGFAGILAHCAWFSASSLLSLSRTLFKVKPTRALPPSRDSHPPVFPSLPPHPPGSGRIVGQSPANR